MTPWAKHDDPPACLGGEQARLAANARATGFPNACEPIDTEDGCEIQLDEPLQNMDIKHVDQASPVLPSVRDDRA